MREETVTYDADGVTLKSRLFCKEHEGSRPAVLVFPEAFGLSDHALSRAQRLAEMGYASLACDIHGNGLLFKQLDEAVGLLKPLYDDRKRMRARGLAALELLTQRKEVDPRRVASIGFCFGGTMSLELARGGADIKAVVGFHSGLATNAPSPRPIRSRILVCIGADDPFIVPDERAAFEAEMRKAGADWQMHLYGGTVHSFTNREADGRGRPEAMRYSAESDARSWASMQELFSRTLS
jgi:dienelactone hydrolase